MSPSSPASQGKPAAHTSASQAERVEMLRTALIDKVGPDSLAHYGIDAASGRQSTNGTVANGTTTATEPAAVADEEEGMHL